MVKVLLALVMTCGVVWGEEAATPSKSSAGSATQGVKAPNTLAAVHLNELEQLRIRDARKSIAILRQRVQLLQQALTQVNDAIPEAERDAQRVIQAAAQAHKVDLQSYTLDAQGTAFVPIPKKEKP